MNDLITILLLSTIAYVVMTLMVFFRLKRPFTLSDVLFGPSDECNTKGDLKLDDLKMISVLKIIPVVNFCVLALYLICGFAICLITVLQWIYTNLIRWPFDQIKFK